MDTEILYGEEEKFGVGGSKVLQKSENDVVTVVGAGITVHEALKAYEELEKEGIKVRVVDAYSVKPIDTETLVRAANETGGLIVVEDHFPEGGLAEAVRSAVDRDSTQVHSMAVTKMPRSGKPEELLAYEEIDAAAIVKKVRELIGYT